MSLRGAKRYIDGADGEIQLVEALAEDPKTDVELINWFAWEAAISPKASDGLLRASLRALLPRLEPHRFDHHDTVATLYHRLERRTDAVRHELVSFDLRTDNFGATQALRFMLQGIDPPQGSSICDSAHGNAAILG